LWIALSIGQNWNAQLNMESQSEDVNGKLLPIQRVRRAVMGADHQGKKISIVRSGGLKEHLADRRMMSIEGSDHMRCPRC
jgi:hypothetical protein